MYYQTQEKVLWHIGLEKIDEKWKKKIKKLEKNCEN